jgi:hypothetical protein
MLNITLSSLLARAPLSTMGFSGSVTTASAYLNGPGGLAGDGFSMPRRGRITALRVWDGSTDRSDSEEITFNPGDRLSVFCQNTGSNFSVRLRLNGSTTTLQVNNVPFNASLFATVEFVLLRD